MTAPGRFRTRSAPPRRSKGAGTFAFAGSTAYSDVPIPWLCQRKEEDADERPQLKITYTDCLQFPVKVSRLLFGASLSRFFARHKYSLLNEDVRNLARLGL